MRSHENFAYRSTETAMMDISQEVLRRAVKDLGGFPIVCNVASAFVDLTKTRTTTGSVLTIDDGNVAAMMR